MNAGFGKWNETKLNQTEITWYTHSLHLSSRKYLLGWKWNAENVVEIEEESWGRVRRGYHEKWLQSIPIWPEAALNCNRSRKFRFLFVSTVCVCMWYFQWTFQTWRKKIKFTWQPLWFYRWSVCNAAPAVGSVAFTATISLIHHTMRKIVPPDKTNTTLHYPQYTLISNISRMNFSENLIWVSFAFWLQFYGKRQR